MAEPGDAAAAAAFIHDAPFEPPQPLLCFDRAACPDYYIHLSDYCVESLDLRSDTLSTVLRWTDNDDYFIDEHDLAGDDDAPQIEDDDEFVVDYIDYERMENYGEAVFKPHVTVHAAVDGYLLISFSSRRNRKWYIINPATRQWVSFFDPTAFGLDVIGFYEHGGSGKYHLLCLSRRNPVVHELATTYTYTVVEVRPAQRRHIGLPLSPAATNDHGLRFGVQSASISPPIQCKRGNMDLLWPPQHSQGYHMLVFDTRTEAFRWKRPPPPVTVTMSSDQEMRLLEFPDGNLGLSVSWANDATLELWCLQDYRNEVWVLKHRIQLALQQMPALHLQLGPWIPAVVSAQGDVLIESRKGLFHCDRDGNLLHRFWFDQTRSSNRAVLPIRHVLRKSLRSHPMFRPSQNAVEPPFFRWLCGDDPSG